MRRIIILAALGSALFSAPAGAVNTWASNTAEDQAEMQRACGRDAYRFCGGNTIFIFEMENCLKQFLPKLSKACRAQLTPTDFRKYYHRETDWLPF